MNNLTDIQKLPYRPGVGIMLLNPANQVFVAKRIDMRSEAWQMPQGGIDEGEDPRIAAFRELQEETGVTQANILHETPDWLDYDLPAELVPVIWKGRFRGQRQKWFIMRFNGDDTHINIETENPEFSEWKWAEYDSLPSLIVPFKKDLYQRLVDDFRPLIFI